MKLKTTGVIFSSALTGYLQKVIQFFVSIVTLPLIIASLGKVQYGILVLIGQTVGFLAMSDIGVSNSIGRFISKYTVQRNKFKIKEVIHTAFFLLLIAAGIIIVITLLLFNWIPDWLNISKEYIDISKLLFVVNGFFLALMFPTRIGQGILSGKQMYPLINLMASFVAIIQFIGVILLSRFKMLGLIELAFLMLGTNLFNQLVIVCIAWRNTPAFTFKNIGFSRSMANRLLNLGLSSFLISISGILVSQGLIIAVGVLTNTITAGIYGVVMLVITNVSFLLTKMTQPMVTLASELTASKQFKKLNDLILLLMRLSLVISFLFSVSLFFYIKPLLRMLLSVSWDSQDYTSASMAIIIMSISITIGMPQFISRAVLQGVGLHWKASIGKVAASIMSFGTGVSLMLFDYGLIGASIGWGLIWVLPGIIYFPTLIAKFMKINQSKIIAIVYFPGYFIGVVLFLVGFLIQQNITELSLLNILAGEFILTLTAGSLFLLFQKMFAPNFNFRKIFIKSK